MNVGFNIPGRVVDTESRERHVRSAPISKFLLAQLGVHRFSYGTRAPHGHGLSCACNPTLHRVNASPTRAGERAPSLNGVVNDGRFEDSRSYVENQLAILRSDSLLRRVVIKEQLAPATSNRRPERRTRMIQRRRNEPS